MKARGAGTPPRDQREEEGQDGKHRIDLEESLRDRLGNHRLHSGFLITSGRSFIICGSHIPKEIHEQASKGL